MLRTGLRVVLLLLLLPSPGRAAEVTAGADEVVGRATYPVRVELRVPAPVAATTYARPDGAAPGAPPISAVPAPIGQQARAAYAGALQRLFDTGPGAPAAVLSVDGVVGRLAWDGQGWRAEVVHQVSLSRLDGEPLAAWRLQGQAWVIATGPGGVAVAFQSAAAMAARRLDRQLEEAPGAVALLREQGIPLLGERRPPEPAPLGAPPGGATPSSPRRFPALFVDLAGGPNLATNDLLGGIRVGWHGGWFAAQVALERSAGGDGQGAEVRQLRYGLDVGAVVRPHEVLELNAGVGVRRMEAELREGPWVPYGGTGRRLLASGFLAIRLSFGTAIAPGRFRVGLELRRYPAGNVSLPGWGGWTSTPTEVAGTEMAVTAGYEGSWGPATAP